MTISWPNKSPEPTAAGDLELKPGGMVCRAGHAVGSETVGHRQDDRPDYVQPALAVQIEVLEIIDRWRRGSCHTEHKIAATVGGECAIGAGRHSHLTHVAVEREIAERGWGADGLAGIVDGHAARADGLRRGCYCGQRHRINPCAQMIQRTIAIERDLVTAG